MLTDMRPFEVIAMTRDLNLTSYAFSKNAEDLQAHVLRYLEIGQSQPFNPDIGDPFGIELARLLANLLASVGSLISGQRAILRDIWPKVGKNLSDFEQGEYTQKRLAVFEADEAKLLVELRNYSQHKFLPYLNPAWQFSQTMPMAEFQFRLHVAPLLKWDSLTTDVRKYLEEHGDSIDLIPIIGRYSAAVREFYRWFCLKIDKKMKPDRVEYEAHVAELMIYGEEVFLTPDWIRQPGGESPPGGTVGAGAASHSLKFGRGERTSDIGRFAESRWTARASLRSASTHGRQSPCASPDGLATPHRVAVWTRDLRISNL